jgi:hypothetical protein
MRAETLVDRLRGFGTSLRAHVRPSSSDSHAQPFSGKLADHL